MGNAVAADAIAISLGVGETVSVKRRAPKSNAAGIASDLSFSDVSLVSIETPFGAIDDRVVVRLAPLNLPRHARVDDDRARITASRARGITARMQINRMNARSARARLASTALGRRTTSSRIESSRYRGRECADARRRPR
jgi:hypothetical protein